MSRPRRTTVWSLLVAATMVLVVACGGSGGGSDGPSGSGSADVTGATASPQLLGGSGPLAKVKVYTGLTQNHVEGGIRYRQLPPVGGDHNPVPLNCGYYDAAVPSPNAVHSMEHGAVWITYRPSLPEIEKGVLKALVQTTPYLVVSPWADEKLPSPVVLSAWGYQLGVGSATDPAVAAFVTQFAQGPQTPEPGAACAGTGNPSAVAG